jgi:hypothetical protein
MRRATAGAGQLSLLDLCLDEQDRAVLAFACRHQQRRDVGDLVGRELGLSPTRYFQLLLAMLERPEVAAVDPELVTRLRAMRDRRRRR